MWKSISAILLAGMLSGLGQAQTPNVQAIKHERDAKISAITAKVQDIEARYWARLVQQGREQLGTLEVDSQSWLGLPEENAKLVALIKSYVNGPQVPALTAEELTKLDENKREVRLFLNNGRENPVAARLAKRNREIREIQEPVFELEARYWAWRVAVVKDITLEELESYSQNWIGERAYNAKLVAQIRQNIETGNTKKLSKKEEKELEESKKNIRSLLNQL